MPNRIAKHRLKAFHRQQGHCHYCDLPMWLRNPEEVAGQLCVRPRTVAGLQCTAEHLVARKNGGRNTAENIVAACRTCNGRRHRVSEPRAPAQHMKHVQRLLRAGKWHPPQLKFLLHQP